MFSALEADARARGVRPLEVKTLGASHPDPAYARTRRFYEKHGFLPLEETELWGEGTSDRRTRPPAGPCRRPITWADAL